MYKAAAILVGVVTLMMGVRWIFEPQITLKLWGVTQTSQDLMVERRLGLVIVIYSLILIFSRNAPPSHARSAICYAAVFGGIALGTMNAYDLFYGSTSSSGVAIGIGVNYMTSVAFALIEWRAYRERVDGAETAP